MSQCFSFACAILVFLPACVYDVCMDTKRCECEHVAHVDRDERTPNGNPAHAYGVRFAERALETIKTTFGTFAVCRDCARDCHALVTSLSAQSLAPLKR